jgi:hypothetical protein
MLDPVGGAKWDAWYSRKGLVPTKLVQEQYVALLLKYDPKWLPPLSCLKFKPQQVQLDNNNLSDEVQDGGDDGGGSSPRSGTNIDGTKKNKKKKNKNNNNNNTNDGSSSSSTSTSSSSLSGNKRSNSAGSLLTVNTNHSMGEQQQQQDKPPPLVRVNSILGLSSNDDEDVERVSKKGWLFKMRVQHNIYNFTYTIYVTIIILCCFIH